ncbi:MAG: hypothetical protein KJ779_02050, partial [Firmicutes bacterium]|nr:hypothetical protein [Bacillota bacterium]
MLIKELKTGEMPDVSQPSDNSLVVGRFFYYRQLNLVQSRPSKIRLFVINIRHSGDSNGLLEM